MTANADNLSRFNVNAPFKDARVITPSDSTEYDGVRGIKVGTGGVVRVVPVGRDDGGSCDLPMAANDGVSLLIKKVMLTGTTCGNIVLFW